MSATDDAIAALSASVTTLSAQVQAVAAEIATLQAGQGATATQINELASINTQVQGLSSTLAPLLPVAS